MFYRAYFKSKPMIKVLCPFFLLGISLLASSFLGASDLLLYKKNSDKKVQLETLQQEIEKKEKTVQEKQKKRHQLLSQLKKQEKEIEKLKRTLALSKNAINKINEEITEFSESIDALKNSLKAQQLMLAQQLDFAFKQGKTHGVQFLLKGEESHLSRRVLAYIDYLNQARVNSVNELKNTQINLSEKKSILIKKKNQQNTLLDQQKTQQIKFKKISLAHEKNLSLLESSIEKEKISLDHLKSYETQLINAILKAQREAHIRHEYEEKKGKKYQPDNRERFLVSLTSGIGAPKGKISWPVKGTLLHHFGESLQGELRWKGMVIATNEGEPVKAIADGYVLLADWLQGYGLVVVIEHGKGDMSLYGYNKKILVKLNTQVKAGQTITLAGSSPLEGKPALYFEIRRQGQAVNPRLWLKK